MIKRVELRNFFESAIYRCAEFYTGQGRSIFPIVGAALLAVASFLPGRLDSWPDGVQERWFLITFSLGIVSTLLGLSAFFLKPSYSRLRKENMALRSELDVRDFEINDHKRNISAVLERAARRALEDSGIEKVGDARISVYVDREQEFVLVSRWSQNAELRKPGRASFPLGQGLIGKAWRESGGAACKNSMSGDRDRWEKEQCDTYGFTAEQAANLTMHARTVAAVRVDGYNASPVIVIESKNIKILTLRATRELGRHDSFVCIADMLSAPNSELPSVHEVRDEPSPADAQELSG